MMRKRDVGQPDQAGIGFTQLGRRYSGMARREAQRAFALSVVLIASGGDGVVFHTVAAVYRLLQSLGRAGEVLLVDRVSPASRLEQLLQEYPQLRILIPTREIAFVEGVLLGAGEAFAPQLLVLDADARLGGIDLERLLAYFEDRRLFAVGLAAGKPSGVVTGRFIKGRVCLRLQPSENPRAALFLPRFAGVYEREKLLMVNPTGAPADSPWSEVDFFYRCWARGWITMVDPEAVLEMEDVSVAEPSGLRSRLRFFRGEIRFLHRNVRDRESRRLRRAFFFRYSLRRLLFFDPIPALACFLERVQYFLHKRIRQPDEAVLSAVEVFDLIGSEEA